MKTVRDCTEGYVAFLTLEVFHRDRFLAGTVEHFLWWNARGGTAGGVRGGNICRLSGTTDGSQEGRVHESKSGRVSESRWRMDG